MSSADFQKNTNDEIQFRIDFKENFGIDYAEAVANFKKVNQESERGWNQLLIKHNLTRN